MGNEPVPVVAATTAAASIVAEGVALSNMITELEETSNRGAGSI
jgi:hypothetical protein